MAKDSYDVHIFNLTGMCPPHGWETDLYVKCIIRLEQMAESMSRLLPEYEVTLDVWVDDVKLVFTRVKPGEEG